MKNFLFLTTLFLWASCNSSDKNVEGDTIEIRARIVNNLAVDGCEWHFELTNADSSNIKMVVPTRATEAKVKAAAPKYGTEDAYSFIDVNFKYRPANTQRKITCGFGKMSTVDEVEVLEINKIR